MKQVRGREKNIGGISVLRVLPTTEVRTVGPFVFLDRFGPAKIRNDVAMDVRPHPHIGLATVTYLYSGSVRHHDSLGCSQTIHPGDMNIMTAGRGIVHSERTPETERAEGSRSTVLGLQFWMGLPAHLEECEPQFAHYPKNDLPTIPLAEGVEAHLLIGSYASEMSPALVPSRTLFLDLRATRTTSFRMPIEEKEIGFVLIRGKVKIEGQPIDPQSLMFFEGPLSPSFEIEEGTRLAIIGGSAFPERRYLWWNFVSTRVERIKSAAIAWESGQFAEVKGESDVIPLPDRSFLSLVK